MTATFPIPHVSVLFSNGDCFETEQVDHLYNLHLELQEAYPMLPHGGFRLKLIEENEEEEHATFQLCIDDYHLQTDVLLEETGDVWIFEIMFSWWLREDEEDGAYDSWSVYVAIDPNHSTNTKCFYGRVDESRMTLISWCPSLTNLLSAYPFGICSNEVIESIEGNIHRLIKELQFAH